MSKKSVIRGIFSLCLVAIILMQLDLNLLMRTTSDIRADLFICAIGLLIMQIIFLSLRWHVYLNAGRAKIPFKTSLFINIAGYFANIIFIASVGSILAKSGLAVRHGIPLVNAVFATILDRIMTLIILILFSAAAIPFLHNIIDSNFVFMLELALIFLGFTLTAMVIALRSGLFKNQILSSKRLSKIMIAVRDFAQNPKMIVLSVLYSIPAQALFIAAVYVLSLGLHHHADKTLEFIALLPILALIAAVPISFGGWGLREGAFVYGLGLIGIPPEDAFLLSVQVGLTSMIAPFIVGIPYFISDNFRQYVSGNIPPTQITTP